VVLPKLAAFFLNVLNTQPELRSLLHVAGFELPEAQKLIREHLSPIFDTVCAYFKRASDRGAICKVDPQLAAFGLLGAVSIHHLLREEFNSRDGSQTPAQAPPVDRPEHYAGLWLHGLMPHPRFTMDPCDEAVSASI
jgi:hypothetical protein